MKNIKIRYKLLMLVAFMIVCLITLGVLSVQFMANINEGTTVVSENWMPSVITSEELNVLTSDYRIQEYRHIVAQDTATMQSAETEMKRIEDEINAQFNKYLTSLITNDEDKRMVTEAQTAWNKYLELHDNMILLSTQNRTAEANQAIAASEALFDEASSAFLQSVEFNKAGADKANLDGNELYANASSIMVTTIIVVTILASFFSFYIVRTIDKPVSELDDVARKIAEGDLDAEIHYQSKDELGQLAINFNKTVVRLKNYVDYIDEIAAVLNQIASGNLVFELTYDYAGEFAKIKTALEAISDSLNSTLGSINEAADQVAAGSDQVSSSAQALSQGATEQASSVEELAATINEISTQIKQTADHAMTARKENESSNDELQVCNTQMQELVSAMEVITQKSNEVSKIIKAIQDIAFQTNILALNAAVEAARAGEAGKGFAVVADEVRNLAAKSDEAAKSTTTLIEETVRAVSDGSVLSSKTEESLIKIVANSQKVLDAVVNIADASAEQATSVAQVTMGIDQISGVVQTNSATAEESAAASEELSGQAQILKGLVGQFKLKTSANTTI